MEEALRMLDHTNIPTRLITTIVVATNQIITIITHTQTDHL